MSDRKCRIGVSAAIVTCCLLYCLAILAKADGEVQAKGGRINGVAQREDAAAAAFESMIPVLRHPRCMNCHSKGDFPRQGNDSHKHTMNVRRGPDGDGVTAVKCSTCHQDHNLAGPRTPPGAPDWHLPSPEMPMIWEGLTDTQLCELFKDPQQNGNRTVDQVVEHMSSPLVLWGWHPGEGRTPVPIPEARFQASAREWASKGAACPGAPHAGPTGAVSGAGR